MNKLFSFILLLFCSCGLKITNEINENVLIGTWELSRLKCYGQDSDTIALEEYIFTGEALVRIEFESTRFQYTASTDDCSTSATANYTTKFNGDGEGKLSYSSLFTSGNCTVDILEQGPAGTVTISLLTNSTNRDNKLWDRDNDILDFEWIADFNGSNVGECKQECTCIGKYSKVTED